MANEKQISRELKRAEGRIPADDTEQFSRIVGAIIQQWDLKKPVDIMTANRMVSSWMKMRYIETMIKKYGLFFERKNELGEVVSIKVNELAYYLKQLEGDFRSYYRLLNTKNVTVDDGKPTDFMSWIQVENPKRRKKKKDVAKGVQPITKE